MYQELSLTPDTLSLAAPVSAGEAPGTRRCHRGGHAECRAADAFEDGDREQDLALPLPESPLFAGRVQGCLDGCPAALDTRVDRFQSCGPRASMKTTPLSTSTYTRASAISFSH